MFGRARDHEAFLEATLRHTELLHALARRLAPTPADAADIVQESFVRAYAAWSRQPVGDVAAWLATICLNVGRDEQRRTSRRSSMTDERPMPDVAGSADTADEAMARLGNDRVQAMLWTLPDQQRVAITLMDICGFTAAQVSNITGAPRGTVLARVHRGRKALALLVDANDPSVTDTGGER